MKTTKELQKENQKLIEALKAITGLVDYWIEDGYVEEEVKKDKAYKKAKKVLENNTVSKRPVKITKVRDTFMVIYLDRIKHGHHSPAQFSEELSDIEYVKKWVENNNLELKAVEI